MSGNSRLQFGHRWCSKWLACSHSSTPFTTWYEGGCRFPGGNRMSALNLQNSLNGSLCMLLLVLMSHSAWHVWRTVALAPGYSGSCRRSFHHDSVRRASSRLLLRGPASSASDTDGCCCCVFVENRHTLLCQHAAFSVSHFSLDPASQASSPPPPLPSDTSPYNW